MPLLGWALSRGDTCLSPFKGLADPKVAAWMCET
jgi:hypothetical protein